MAQSSHTEALANIIPNPFSGFDLDSPDFHFVGRFSNVDSLSQTEAPTNVIPSPFSGLDFDSPDFQSWGDSQT